MIVHLFQWPWASTPVADLQAIHNQLSGPQTSFVRLVSEIGGPALAWDRPLPIPMDPRRAVAAIYRILPTPQEQP